MTLESYIRKVNFSMSDLTGNVLYLSLMVNFADGPASLSELYESRTPPREAARVIIFAMGMQEALDCWSTECDFCEFDDGRCPHVDSYED